MRAKGIILPKMGQRIIFNIRKIISTLSVILSSEIMTVAVNFSDQNDVLLGHIYQKQPNVVVFDAQISI